MGIVEGTLLGILTIASLLFVWAAIREQDKQNLYHRTIERSVEKASSQDSEGHNDELEDDVHH